MPDLTTLVQPRVVRIQSTDGLCRETSCGAPPTEQTADHFEDVAD